MNFLKKYWPTIVALGGAALPYAIPALQATAAAYPKSTIGVLCGAIIAAYHMRAPKDQARLQ